MSVPFWPIPCFDKNGDLCAVVGVDEDIWREIESAGRRYQFDGKYAGRNTSGTRVRLHREVLGLRTGDGQHADHINGDRLDCRRENLRVVTHAQNCQNQTKTRGISRFRGVYREKRTGNWCAHGGGKYLGTFRTEEEAGKCAAEWRATNMPFSKEAMVMGKSIASMQEQPAGNGVTGSVDKGTGSGKLKSEDIPRGSGGGSFGVGGAIDSQQSKTGKGQ